MNLVGQVLEHLTNEWCQEHGAFDLLPKTHLLNPPLPRLWRDFQLVKRGGMGVSSKPLILSGTRDF
jgi:hypothetical protein